MRVGKWWGEDPNRLGDSVETYADMAILQLHKQHKLHTVINSRTETDFRKPVSDLSVDVNNQSNL